MRTTSTQRLTIIPLIALATLGLGAATAAAQTPARQAAAVLATGSGEQIGTATFTEMPSGARVAVQARGLQ
ncbi:MAG: hypothetical protein ACRDI2_13555, partial [Chloroflexota bacterium]